MSSRRSVTHPQKTGRQSSQMRLSCGCCARFAASAARYLVRILSCQLQARYSPSQRLIVSPQTAAGQESGGKQMNVNPSQAMRVKPSRSKEMHDLFVLSNRNSGQCREQPQYFCTIAQVTAGQFTYHERMGGNAPLEKQRLEAFVSHAKVIHPNRCVHKCHAATGARRLGGCLRFFSVPPSLASRRALDMAMRASSPRRTRDVFSLTPVSLAACRRSLSSMLSVVLMRINMHY